MSEEIKNNVQEEQQSQQSIQGWRDVQVSADIPLTALVQFLNILNQRLSTIEDNVKIPLNNNMVSLTEAYKMQTEAEMEAQRQAQAQENNEESKGE